MFFDVGSIVCDTEKESIRHRGCRVLANLCQTVACCDIIHEDHAKIFSTVVSDLCTTMNSDCKVTYCRLVRYTFCLLVHWHLSIFNTPTCPPFPQIYIIRAVMIVWRVRGKIIRNVMCSIMYKNCAQCNAHTFEQT